MAETVYALKRDGKIVGIFRNLPADPKERAASEVMEDDHPDVVAFVNRPAPKFDPEKARRNGGAVTPEGRIAALEAEIAAMKAARR